ncbi:MAG TPA: LptA/OstA family protein [Stellaceae bacterium]|jgi:lipopolysaccharide export system protein LptA|nr:LptA/OstA family protein [Stellaceae bacterium]
MRRGAVALLAVFALVIAASDTRAQGQQSNAPQSNALGLAGDDNNNKPVNIEAENGIEWQQNNKVYIARGNAKATRGDDAVTADTLYAYYRDAQQPQQAASASPQLRSNTQSGQQSPFDSGSTQVYRLVAQGHVVFTTPSQTAYGDQADYSVDEAMLVVTGKNLKIVTQQDIVTARDSFEWYDQKQIGVARGDAIAVRQGPEHKSIRGDVLTAEVTKPANQPSKISKVNAQGHVILVSEDQIARGDTGVYNLDTGIATMSGHVSLTRGENQLRGQYAVVDTNTNVARLLAAPPSAQATGPKPRVEGLLIPRQNQPGAPTPGQPGQQAPLGQQGAAPAQTQPSSQPTMRP